MQGKDMGATYGSNCTSSGSVCLEVFCREKIPTVHKFPNKVTKITLFYTYTCYLFL
jgi:hypothetical protein